MVKVEEEIKLLTECKSILRDLVDAAMPFISGDIVDETSGTIPLIENLDRAINRAKEVN